MPNDSILIRYNSETNQSSYLATKCEEQIDDKMKYYSIISYGEQFLLIASEL